MYRGNFWGYVVTSFAWGGFHIAQALLITSRSSHFYSWTRGDMLLLIGTFSIVRGMVSVLFTQNIDKLIDMIATGGLDVILLKPIKSQFYASTIVINFTAVIRCVLGVWLLFYTVHTYHPPVTVGIALGYFIFCITGIVLGYSVYFIAATILLWNPMLTNMKSMMNYLSGMGRYPSETYQNWGKVPFVLLYPFIIYTIPGSRLLAGKLITSEAVSFFLVTIFLAIFSVYFWKYSLRRYTSANV